MLREAMFHDNIEVEIRSADDSNEKQISDIKYFADEGFDIVIAAPNEAEAITPVIDEVMARNIPVIVFDRMVTGENFTAFQGADNDSIGAQAAKYAASVMHGNGRVLEIYGNPESTPARGRHNGFVRAIEQMPGMSIAATAVGNWNYDLAYKVADSLLSIYPDADVIYAHNDRMAMAASDAAKKHGVRPYIIGVDAAPEIGMKAVADGQIDATFLYPTEGESLLKMALAILDGKPYNKYTRLPASSAVDRGNADILILQNESLKEETAKIGKLQKKVDQYWQAHSAQTTLIYAFIIILVLLVLLLLLFFRAYWQRKKHQVELEKQNRELERQRDTERNLNDQLQTATQSKLIFYTNVSHDLRTPLTLISEPINELSDASNLTPQQHTLVKIAKKNVKILQRLINQVLDFRKYENEKLALHLTEVDFYALVEDWTDAFRAVAKKRDIKLMVNCSPKGGAPMAIDVEKIERVFFNLLSNAFKYSPDNGTVTVTAHYDENTLELSVTDTGVGISEDDLPHIFDRFFQVDKVHPNGSGIGLSLAKAFVELHEGTMTAESVLGKGSVFTVRIPVRHVSECIEHPAVMFGESDVIGELARVEDERVGMLAETVEDDEQEKKPLLLAIDDNNDILMLITQLLSDRYRVITAANGADGVRMAAKYVPDLVVCDVMMPGMDGLECCRRIKNEVTTSHIPVLLLTACSMDEQRAEGYESGADGYISKPFNSKVLLSRCDNLVANRRRIRDLWKSDAHSESIVKNATEGGDTSGRGSATLPAPNSIDSEFYNKFIALLRDRLGDADINVDNLASEMGLGRSQFYRKIKALTNYSPVELIRSIRLKEARARLLTTEQTVSEIAYGVGFSTPAYFTKCYREAYGETPSETRTGLTK